MQLTPDHYSYTLQHNWDRRTHVRNNFHRLMQTTGLLPDKDDFVSSPDPNVASVSDECYTANNEFHVFA